jgi:hypothetical protein
MKKTILVSITIVLSMMSLAQPGNNSDSIIQFKVAGNCGMCKSRIEKAASAKGVSSAIWSEESKLLTLTYKPSVVSVDKIKDRIVAAGHDLEDKKAKDKLYQALPECCHYREAINPDDKTDSAALNQIELDTTFINKQRSSADNMIKGVVLEADKKGSFKPLNGASVIWLDAKKGTSTDSSGFFAIEQQNTHDKLIISYAGYRPDTVSAPSNSELRIILANDKQLRDVTIYARQRSSYISSLNPIRTQVMTEKELFKAACCNLSESFETNPSVDVSYNDAVTGSKQIQLLGLSGNYTQLTVENLPGPRGLATPLGLNSIAGPWVESIQLTKGVGSVANGFESIAGQINVELKKPVSDEKLYANIYVNDQGKTDLNLNLTRKLSDKWSTALLLHNDFLFNKKLDFNNDHFRDLPTGNQFSFINRWLYHNNHGFETQFGIKMLNDNRTGGDVDFDPATDKYSTHHYGLGIKTERYEGFAKIGYVFPEKKYKSIGLQLSSFDHQQDSYFGLSNYKAHQQNFYANLIYQSIIGNTSHNFRAGISFLYDGYNENYNLTYFNRKETVPGAFFEYTYTASDKFIVVAGLRADHNSLYGAFVTPRLHVKYDPFKGTSIRLSAGRGQRTANIFAENMAVFVSSRQMTILPSTTGKAYGLNPEVAWNKGISIDQQFTLFNHHAIFSIDFFRNDFNDQVVADLEDPRYIQFYNLTGRSYSNSFQSELDLEPLKNLEMRLAYRYYDVQTSYSGNLLQKPFTSKHRAFMNLAYAIKGWKFDYTINHNGSKRIPYTGSNPSPYKREEWSPAFVIMNAQISKTVGKKHPMDFYIGSENITGYFQKDVIIAADQPFGSYFDASLVWGPVTGRMFYAGWRFKLK